MEINNKSVLSIIILIALIFSFMILEHSMTSSYASNIIHSFLGKTTISINGAQLLFNLTTQKYSTWHAQITHLLLRHNLKGYAINSTVAPLKVMVQYGYESLNLEIEFWEFHN